MTCDRCHIPTRQGMTVALPRGETRLLCLGCLRDALAAVLAMLEQQTHADLALALVGVGHQQLLAAALEAAGLSKEGSG